MANNVDISTVLKRNLKGGKEFDILMPRVRCKTTPLGNGDTFFTVDRMKDWIEKFRHQTAKLALRLEGQTVEETVNNIYNFLYNHIQYTADGSLQQLRSPACTWMQRKQGVDCKSYSVFASCILSNLGIKHAVRQVRQAYFYPEEFTHVYVVVFKDQDKENYSENAPTYVIDATKHENTEVNYIEKVDQFMNKLSHVGLNAPQDERTANIITNFNTFCQFLIENGIPVATVDAIRAEVSKYTSRGEDPKFEIYDKGIVVSGKPFKLDFVVDKEYEAGLGFVATAGAAATAGKKLLDMLPPDFFGSTFGAVFANGFDLSCWNASYSISKGQAAVAKDLPYLAGKYSGLDQGVTTESLNKFLNGVEGYIANAKNGQKSKFAKCTREGYAEVQKSAEAARDGILDQLKNSVKLTPTGSQQGHVRTTEMPSKPDGVWEWGHASDNRYSYKSYRVEGKTQVSTPKTPTKGNNSGQYPQTTTGGNNYQPTGQNNYQPTGNGSGNDQPKSGGSNTGIIIGGVALATLPFLIPMMKKSPVAAKPAKKKSK